MERPLLVFFSDLDGTLLDSHTYAFDAARPALAELRRAGIPLVLCSSKTRAEIERLRSRLDNADPFVAENGGAVFIPDGYFPVPLAEGTRSGNLLVVPIGTPHGALVVALERASRASAVPVRSFSRMSDEEVAAATGLPLEEARLARRREFDEPFEVLEPERTGSLLAAIEREGMRWTAGGRFHHIVGASDKGTGVRLLTDLYRRSRGPVTTVGLGDAANDAAFLAEVDVPVLVASPQLDRLRALVPHGRTTRASGPAGWNEAVLALLDEDR